MADRELPCIPHAQAYPFRRRVRDAHKFIRKMARDRGAHALERTQSRFVAITYGVPANLIKKMKAKFRNELSFSDGGK